MVTGGAGFIGSHIVEYLLLHGAKVRVLDDFSTGFKTNVKTFANNPNFELLQGDIRDVAVCAHACKNVDAISHQAAIGSVPRSIENPTYTNAVNVGGFVNLLKAAHQAGIKRIVYASSSSVYGDEATLPKKEAKIGKPLSPYAASKYCNEVYADVFAKVYGLELIGFRYFNIFGPRQSPKGAYAAVIPLFIDGLLHEKKTYIDGDGQQTRDFTFVSNAVQANIKAMLTDNRQALNTVYNIAVGNNYSINELHQVIARSLGSGQQAVYRNPRAGDVKNSLADISKAGQLLNYQPLVDFYEGIEKTITFFKKNNAV